jgi:Domain of unknown function (DUF4150)
MSNDVFANGREIACKAADGKAICAFPDVCMTPPENPATPPGVPVPYPNTGMASDTSDGSTTVKISGKEVMLKNKSCFKKSTGDEAGAAAKKGVVTSVNRGKVYFTAWSMDVKFEGENVDRHLDMTTHDHASQPPDTPPWTYIDSQAVPPADHPCKTEIEEAQKACKGATVTGSGQSAVRDCSKTAGDCQKKMACILVPKEKDKQLCCAPHNTGHHMVPAHSCKGVTKAYDSNKAPTVCAGGHSWHRFDKSKIPDNEKTHPALHEIQDPIERKVMRCVGKLAELGKITGRSAAMPWKFMTCRNIAISAHKKIFKDSECSTDCMKSQLDRYHNSVGIDDGTLLKASEFGNKISPSDKSYQNWMKKYPGLKPPGS